MAKGKKKLRKRIKRLEAQMNLLSDHIEDIDGQVIIPFTVERRFIYFNTRDQQRQPREQTETRPAATMPEVAEQEVAAEA